MDASAVFLFGHFTGSGAQLHSATASSCVQKKLQDATKGRVNLRVQSWYPMSKKERHIRTKGKASQSQWPRPTLCTWRVGHWASLYLRVISSSLLTFSLFTWFTKKKERNEILAWSQHSRHHHVSWSSLHEDPIDPSLASCTFTSFMNLAKKNLLPLEDILLTKRRMCKVDRDSTSVRDNSFGLLKG